MDYNIEHYTIKDLEEMLNLKQPYTSDNVYQMENELKHKLFNECGYTTKYTDMSEFISNAINKILFSLPPTKSETINDVIIPPVIPTLHTQEKPFVRGNINTLSIPTISRTLTINSKFRNDGTSSQFNIELPYQIHQVTSLTLNSVTIPFQSYYSINSNNQYFLISINTGTTYETIEVVIPVGNYTSDEFISKLNIILIAIESNFNVSFDTISNIITIENTLYDFTLNFYSPSYIKADTTTGIFQDQPTNDITLGLGWLMGYRESYYNGGKTYTAESPLNLFGEYIYLILNDYVNNTVNENIGMLSSSYLDRYILAKLPIQNSKNVNTTWENKNIVSIRNYFGPVQINKLTIQLMDEYGRIIDLNKNDWSFSVIFTCLYSEL
jgi:hypothetical protein